MTSQQVAQIHVLREEGYSIREIAAELAISKSNVERALKLPIAGTDGVDDDEDEEEAMVETPKAKSSWDNKNQRGSKQPDPVAVPTPTSQAAEVVLRDLAAQRQLRQEAEERLERRKQWFVDKTNRLIKELISNARKTTWEEAEADEYVERVNALKEKVRTFCDKQAIDEEGLQLWAVLTELVGLIDEHLDRPFLGTEAEFNLPKGTIRHWKDNMIETFEDEVFESEDNEEDEDSDEVEEDEDDE